MGGKGGSCELLQCAAIFLCLEKPPVTKEFSEKMLMAAHQAHCIAGELNDPQLLSIAKQLWLSAHSKLIIAGKV